MPDRVTTLHLLIAQQRQLGLNPRELHMAEDTYLAFVKEAKLEPIMPTDTRSILARLRQPYDGPKPHDEFDGLRIVPNAKIPGAAIILRPAQLMTDPMWLEHHIHFGEPQQPAMPPKGTPWIEKREKQPEDPPGSDSGALELLGRAGGVSPSDVVMKSLDGIDGVKDILVLRFRNNGEVEMSSTLDRMSIMGALQMAIGFVMRNE